MKANKIKKVKFSDEEETILKEARDILQKVSKDFDNGNYGLYSDNYEHGMENVICDIYRAALNII